MKRPAVATLGAATLTWLAFVLPFAPGVFQWDLYGVYERCVLGGVYEDFHSPVLCAVWRGLEPVGRGLTPLFFLQVTALVAGVFLVARAADSRGRWGAMAFAVFAVPAVTTHVFWVMKDTLMVACLVLGVGLLIAGGSRTHRAAAIALFFAANCTRHNAIVAIIPLLAWALRHGSWRRTALHTAVAVALFVAGKWTLDYGALGAQGTGPAQPVQQHDLLAIRRLTGENLAPRDYMTPEVVERLVPLFDHGNLDLTYWLEPAQRTGFAPSRDAEVLRQLRDAWLRAIARHPGAYLTHRTRAFSSFVGLDEVGYHFSFMSPVSPDDAAGDDFPRDTPRLRVLGPFGRRWTELLTTIHERARWTFLPITWLAASLAIAVAAVLRRRPVQTILMASSLLHAAPLFFVGPVMVHRYVYWNVWAVALALVVEWTGVERTPPGPRPGSFAPRLALVVLACLAGAAALFARPHLHGEPRAWVVTGLAGARTALATNGYTPPEGSSWDAEEALPVPAGTSLDLVVPRRLRGLELQLGGDGVWALSASTDGATFEPVAVFPRTATEGLRTSRLELAEPPWRVLRLEPREGGARYSVGEVRPFTAPRATVGPAVDFGLPTSWPALRHGWVSPELDGAQPFRSALGAHACVELPEPTPAAGTIRVRVSPADAACAQQLAVRLNGVDAGVVRLSPGFQEYRLNLPPGAARAQTRVELDSSWVPGTACSDGARALTTRFDRLEISGD